jgi:phage terminase large subunit GpA-like protein
MGAILQGSFRAKYASADDICRSALSLLLPPSRLKPSESAGKYLYVPKDGDYRLWDKTVTPELVAPLDRLADRSIKAVIFVGPSQTGKTESLISGWMAHSVAAVQADMMIVQSSQHEARYFSRRRIDRSIRISPALSALAGVSHDDNVFDKRFKNGVHLNIGWPTIGQLSGKSIPHMAMTEFDKYDENIGGEGDAFFHAMQRTKAFKSRGRTLVESTPGRQVIDPDWEPKMHAAPPCSGILSLYNLSDRHRMYWACVHCDEEFLAEMENFTWDKTIDDPAHAASTAAMLCPHCGSLIGPEHKDKMRQEALLQIRGGWRSEADKFDTGLKSKYGGYWMQGPAAAFQSWNDLAYNYLTAMQDWESTGSEEKLRGTTNTDQGRPYAGMKKRGDAMDAVLLKQRAERYAEQRKVPAEARFVTIFVDVQKHRFVVQVQAFGADRESWIVDRYNLTHSERIGEDGQRQKVSPFSYAEDWNVLDKLLADEFGIEGAEGKVQARMIAVDSGGADEATNNAYAYAARLQRLGKAGRFALTKGASSSKSARIATGKAGDDRIRVPLYIVNSNLIKDEVIHSLSRAEAGPGYLHLPDWVGDWFFKELTAEEKLANGRYVKRRKADNNEALDLCVGNLVCYSLVGGDRIDWAKPPEWCAKPLGNLAPDDVKSDESGNSSFLKWMREKGMKSNGE